MLFLTLTDQPSGVYDSQVIDVVRNWQANHNKNTRLVAFFSVRTYLADRKYVKSKLPNTIALPLFPMQMGWQLNALLLGLTLLWLKQKNMVTRGIYATNLALMLKKTGLVNRICYDGRGAIVPEWQEYMKKNAHKAFIQSIAQLERRAVVDTHYRLAVSNALVQYWQQNFGYNQQQHVVMPCTLDSQIDQNTPSQTIDQIRLQLKIEPSDTLIAYAGSLAAWQSSDLTQIFLYHFLKQHANNKILFLSWSDDEKMRLQAQFPNQVTIKWVEHNQIQHHLAVCHYGLLIREQSMTNKVASPAKFAEYLSAGLSVIISENLGDYTQFVEEKKCGIVINQTNCTTTDLKPIDTRQRLHNQQLLKKYLSKTAPEIQLKYKTMLQSMSHD